MRIKKIFLFAPFILCLITVPLLAGCKKSTNPRVRVEMENGGVFILELYPEHAPETVKNFTDLVESGYYDGLTFHRIINGFMAQGGCPLGTGTGGSGINIKGEFASNGFTNNKLKHEQGVISMARSGDPNSASSQFFIMLGDAKHLDGDYAAFGKVVEGFDVVTDFEKVDKVYNANREFASPVTPVVIKEMKLTDK